MITAVGIVIYIKHVKHRSNPTQADAVPDYLTTVQICSSIHESENIDSASFKADNDEYDSIDPRNVTQTEYEYLKLDSIENKDGPVHDKL